MEAAGGTPEARRPRRRSPHGEARLRHIPEGPRLRHISEYRGIFLPAGAMLQIHRVVALHGDRIVCETDLDGSWVFPLHFPGDPIFPGSLLIEGAGQAIAVWAWENELRGDPRLVRVSAEFRSPVRPGDRVLTYRGTVRRRRNVCVGSVDVLAGGRAVATVAGSLVGCAGSAALPPASPEAAGESRTAG